MIFKAEIRLWIFYKNPIRGKFFKKWDVLFTHCPYCGKRFRISKKHIGQNKFEVELLYCKTCLKEDNRIKKKILKENFSEEKDIRR